MTDSAVSDQNSNKVQCRASVTYLGFLLLERTTWNGFLTDVFHQRRFTVWSLADLCWIAFGRVGTDSVGFLPCERYNSDQNQIENGIIRTKTAESGRFLDNIWWLSLLYKYFLHFLRKFEFPATNHRILIRLLTQFIWEWFKDGSKTSWMCEWGFRRWTSCM